MNGIQGVGRPIAPQGIVPSPGGPGGQDFHAEFDAALQKHDLKFSRHALDRLRTRNVNLGSNEVERLGNAVEQAGQKGARESLVMLDELAFVVSVRNRTVITALQGKQSGVFTSIDSAVIA